MMNISATPTLTPTKAKNGDSVLEKRVFRGHGRPKQSLRSAINLMCRHCIYDPGQGGAWREQVTACTSTTCPLYAARPTSEKVHR